MVWWLGRRSRGAVAGAEPAELGRARGGERGTMARDTAIGSQGVSSAAAGDCGTVIGSGCP